MLDLTTTCQRETHPATTGDTPALSTDTLPRTWRPANDCRVRQSRAVSGEGAIELGG